MNIPTELRPLIDVARSNGYRLAQNGRGPHMKVVDEEGNPVVDQHGPVTVAATPGDVRARANLLSRFIKAGIITEEQNPWKPHKTQSRPTMKQDEAAREREEARKAGVAALGRERAARTQAVASRLAPIVERLGGYQKQGMIAELGLVLHHFTSTRYPNLTPGSRTSAAMLMAKVRDGGTLNSKNTTALEHLADFLESRDDPVRAWMELVREAKGVRHIRTAPSVEAPAAPTALADSQPGVQAVEDDRPRTRPYRTPTLALRTLAHMVRYLPAGEETTEQLALAEAILEMELQR